MSDMDPEILSGYARAELLDYCTYKPATVNFVRSDFYAVSLFFNYGPRILIKGF
jgi:hypothetical protein